MSNIAIIPARSGSQRTPHKNIKLVAGHPLMYYQIECARQVPSISKVVVATDSKLYAEVARSLGADVVMRPPSICGPKSKTEETLLYVVDKLEARGEFYENVILLQITNPLNHPKYIQEGLNALENGRYNSVVTWQEFNRFFLDDSDIIERPMTQDRTPRKLETGAFWIIRTAALKKENNRICLAYAAIKVPHRVALEVDFPEDLMLIEAILERQMRVKEGKYFKAREYNDDFEDYYGPKPDPDGKIRDISKEKDHRIAFFKAEVDFVSQIGKDGKRRKILDLGCGAGFVTSAIKGNWETYGLELSRKAAGMAGRYIDHVHLGQLETDTYEEEFFDVIQCLHVIEHVKDPISFVQVVHKILKTHGHLILVTPNFDSGAARHFAEKFRLLHDKSHISLFSDRSLKCMLEDFGFIVDRIEYPFFETEYFTKQNLLRMFDTSKISPPFYGSIMTFYARKK